MGTLLRYVGHLCIMRVASGPASKASRCGWVVGSSRTLRPKPHPLRRPECSGPSPGREKSLRRCGEQIKPHHRKDNPRYESGANTRSYDGPCRRLRPVWLSPVHLNQGRLGKAAARPARLIAGLIIIKSTARPGATGGGAWAMRPWRCCCRRRAPFQC